jgi:tetratricopeptide (TPR) repeat protein
MPGDEHDHDATSETTDTTDPMADEPVDGDADEEFDEDDESENPEQIAKAAATIEVVILPIACTNEGKGAPLAMGIQRWWAQELASRGSKAAAPVFTAMTEQNGQKVPALMVFREPWVDGRAKEGIDRFSNAKYGLVTDLRIDDDNVAMTSRLVGVSGTELVEQKRWSWVKSNQDFPDEVVTILRDLAGELGVEYPHQTWQDAFGTQERAALTSFLIGLGNLSALQGRCVPTTSEQLLAPFVDAINRDPKMDVAMQGLHSMVDILVANQIEESTLPLALQALSVAAQKRENDNQAYFHLAMLLRRLGDLNSAVKAFNQAFNIDPTHEEIACQFIDTLRSAGDAANAMKVAQFAAERGNESPRLMARLGSLMIEDDQFDEAEPFLRRAVDEGQVPSAYGDLANVLWDRGEEDDEDDDRKEAMSLLEQAVERPAIAKSTLDMLIDLHEEEKNENATMLLLRAAQAHPQNATVLRYVATMYLDGDDPQKAGEYLDRILALPRRTLDDDAFARRGRLTLGIDDFEDRYDDAIEKVRSGSPEDTIEAAKFLREVIAADDKFWQPHLMLALAVREGEGDGAALAHLMNAVRLRPNDSEIRNLIAAILRKQGRPKEAVDHLRVVVALNPRDVEPVVQLATCMRDANLFGEARQVCQAALQMLPDHPEFKRILASLPAPQTKT